MSKETHDNDAQVHPGPPYRAVSPWLGYTIGPVFLLLAVWFVVDPSGTAIPLGEARTVDPARLSTAPRRLILSDPPQVAIGGFDRTCMDCHRSFPPRETPPARLLQHKEIKLNHGINSRCRNCHDPVDRNRLILRDGRSIAYGDVVELCAQCHGPTYRDWQRGAHGRTSGYWDATSGESVRLKCTECHDPHVPRVPAMDPIEPLPGPHTLRMGTHAPDEHAREPEGSKRNPLHIPWTE